MSKKQLMHEFLQSSLKTKMRFILASLALVVLANGVREATAKATLPEDGTIFGLSQSEVADLYKVWVETDSTGKDKSLQGFISWMKEYDDRSKLRPGDDVAERSLEDASNIQRSETEERNSKFSDAGIDEGDLQLLYKLWLKQAPADADTSFQAFTEKIKIIKPSEKGDLRPGSQQFWGRVCIPGIACVGWN